MCCLEKGGAWTEGRSVSSHTQGHHLPNLPDRLSAVDLTQDLSSLACSSVTGLLSWSGSSFGHEFKFVIVHPVSLVSALMEVTF